MLALVFNELSSPPWCDTAPTSDIARSWLDQFAAVITDRRVPTPKTLFAPAGFQHWRIGADVSLAQWRKMPREHDLALRLGILLDHSEEFPIESSDGLECRIVAVNAAGLGLAKALDLDGLAISFPSAPVWDVCSLQVERSEIAGDDIMIATLNLPHASRAAHLAQNVDWLRSQGWSLPLDGHALWRQRDQFFPHLDFCDSVQPQIEPLAAGCAEYKAIARGLRDLETVAETWNDGTAFTIQSVPNASGESESTRQQFSAERTFLCPDGEKRVFNWHLKRGDYRIHFIENAQSHRFLVGYAGRHLPTSKFH